MQLDPKLVTQLRNGLIIVDAPWEDSMRYKKLSLLIHEAFPVFKEFSKKRKTLFYNYRYFTLRDNHYYKGTDAEPVGSVVKENKLSFNLNRKKLIHIDKMFISSSIKEVASVNNSTELNNSTEELNNRLEEVSKCLQDNNQHNRLIDVFKALGNYTILDLNVVGPLVKTTLKLKDKKDNQ